MMWRTFFKHRFRPMDLEKTLKQEFKRFILTSSMRHPKRLTSFSKSKSG